jgi:hypothetical protein
MPRTIRSRIRETNPEAVAPEVTPAPKVPQKVTVTARKSFFVGNAIIQAGETTQVTEEIHARLVAKGLI